MELQDIEELGLNRNEARVYLGLVQKGRASAAELVKLLGVHRNIVYDNLEKLIDKGLASYIVEESRKVFIANDPDAIIEFLHAEKEQIDEKISSATSLLPRIRTLLSSNRPEQDASIFRGRKGIKKILKEILEESEFWVIGVSRASIETLGETYWKSFNMKRKNQGIKEHLLLNHDFVDSVNLGTDALSHQKVLPKELTQVTEIMVFGSRAAILVYSGQPLAILIDDSDVAATFKQQFEFLWNLAPE